MAKWVLLVVIVVAFLAVDGPVLAGYHHCTTTDLLFGARQIHWLQGWNVWCKR